MVRTVIKTFLLFVFFGTIAIGDELSGLTASSTNIQPGSDVNLTMDYVVTKKYQLHLNAYNEQTGDELSPTFIAQDLRHVVYRVPDDIDYNIKIVAKLIEDGNQVDSKEVLLSFNADRKSCLDYYDAGERNNGIYEIYPLEDQSTSVSVYCDMDNGGWTKYINMNEGWDGHPGDYNTKVTNRISPENSAVYLALAKVSTYQKFDIAKGQSEATYDWFQFRRKNDSVIFSPDNHGTHCGNTRTWGESGEADHSGEIITINKDPENAFWYTRYDTDCSVNRGDGAYVNNVIWFK